jgi:hypothetical protein
VLVRVFKVISLLLARCFIEPALEQELREWRAFNPHHPFRPAGLGNPLLLPQYSNSIKFAFVLIKGSPE